MKVALCFSGQMRNVQLVYNDYIKPNIIEPNAEDHEIDVFVHSWFDIADVGKGYHISGDKGMSHTTPIPADVMTSVFECYNPKKILVERQKVFHTGSYYPHRLPFIVPDITLSKCYSMKQVNLLKCKAEEEAGQPYDLVAQFRFDLAFKSPVFFNTLNPRAYTTSNEAAHAVDVCKGIMGSSEANIVMNLYDKIDEYWREDRIEFIDEELMRHHLDKHGIPIVHNMEMTNCSFLR